MKTTTARYITNILFSKDQASPQLYKELPSGYKHTHDVYDLIITDGEYKIKVTLSPNLNESFEKIVSNFWGIIVSKWKRTTIKREHDPNFDVIFVEQFALRGAITDRLELKELLKLPWLYYEKYVSNILPTMKETEERNEFLKKEILDKLEFKPQLGSRKSYLHMLCDDCPIGGQWATKDVFQNIEEYQELWNDPLEQFGTLEELHEMYVQKRNAESIDIQENNETSTKRISWSEKNRFLVLRVLAKSRLEYYGKLDTDFPYPYKFSVRVIDISKKELDLEFWATSCPTFFSSLVPGLLIRISSYRVRERYLNNPLTCIATGKFLDPQPRIELAFNPSKERGSLSILYGKGVAIFEDKIPPWAVVRTSLKGIERFVPSKVSSSGTLASRNGGQQNNSSNQTPASPDALNPENESSTPTQDVEEVRDLIDCTYTINSSSSTVSIIGEVIWVGTTERLLLRKYSQTVSDDPVKPPYYSYMLYKWIRLRRNDRESHHDIFIQVGSNSQAAKLTQIVPHTSIFITHVRLERHHECIVGFTTHISQILVGTEAEEVDPNTSFEGLALPRDKDSIYRAISQQSCPFTLPFTTYQQYVKAYKAYELTDFSLVDQIGDSIRPFERRDFVISGIPISSVAGYTRQVNDVATGKCATAEDLKNCKAIVGSHLHPALWFAFVIQETLADDSRKLIACMLMSPETVMKSTDEASWQTIAVLNVPVLWLLERMNKPRSKLTSSRIKEIQSKTYKFGITFYRDSSKLGLFINNVWETEK